MSERLQVSEFAESCRLAAGPAWEACLEHPFVGALRDGVVAREALGYYVQQDRIYLQAYADACAALAERADETNTRELLRNSAELSRTEETGVLEAMAAELRQRGLAELTEVDPATVAYRDHLRAATTQVGPAVGLAALTPCNWLYAEVGWSILDGLPMPLAEHPFRGWVSLYSGDAVQQQAQGFVDALTAAAAAASREETHRAREAFAASVRHELSFWDMGWRAGRGPPLTLPKELPFPRRTRHQR